MKKLRSQAGFSLLELMTAAAIIIILTAVAIPRYNRYQLKVHRSEGLAKAALIKGALMAFHGQYSIYAACLGAMGVDLSGGWWGIGVKGSYTDSSVPTKNAVARSRGAVCPDAVSGALTQGMFAFPATKEGGPAGCSNQNMGIEGQTYGYYSLSPGTTNIGLAGYIRACSATTPNAVEWYNIYADNNFAGGVQIQGPFQYSYSPSCCHVDGVTDSP